ncbi:MAG: DHH family phosphoesterase [Pseudomonadales bacterium]
MTIYDVFNGDADGICALLQLRHAESVESQLITGVKRDIKLLTQVDAGQGDRVNVLDVSMDKNKADLVRILDAGASVFYCDHHVAGDIPTHTHLSALINPAADVCTSLLINGYLKGAFSRWAIVGAFGDNLKNSAQALARTVDLTNEQVTLLENLGIYINYNGYGASLSDLHFEPADLYHLLRRYSDPLDFIKDDAVHFSQLESGYQDDMAKAQSADTLRETPHSAAFLLPNEKWARRVSGVYGNDLANQHPERAHAVLTSRPDDTYLVSVRAPLNNKVDADTLCMGFPTGGGRKAAAGINALPAAMLDQFLDRLDSLYR